MKFIESDQNTWTAVADDTPVTPAPHLALSPAQWQTVRTSWPADLPVALRLANDSDVETIADDLPRVAAVLLHFPKWTDGRAYSQTRLLRSRYRFTGEVRATGDVVVDMMPLLQRSCFDAVALRADQSVEIARRQLTFFPAYYQGDVHDNRPHFARVTPQAEAA